MIFSGDVLGSEYGWQQHSFLYVYYRLCNKAQHTKCKHKLTDNWLGKHSDIPGEIDQVHISKMRDSADSAEHKRSALLWKCPCPHVMIFFFSSSERDTPPYLCDGIAPSSSSEMISPLSVSVGGFTQLYLLSGILGFWSW